jgi:hypothetical protein
VAHVPLPCCGCRYGTPRRTDSSRVWSAPRATLTLALSLSAHVSLSHFALRYMGGPADAARAGRPGTAMASFELRPASPTRRQLPAYGSRARPDRPDTAGLVRAGAAR